VVTTLACGHENNGTAETASCQTIPCVQLLFGCRRRGFWPMLVSFGFHYIYMYMYACILTCIHTYRIITIIISESVQTTMLLMDPVGARFQSRSGHRLFQMTLQFLSLPPDKYPDNTLIRTTESLLIPSISLFINYPTIWRCTARETDILIKYTARILY
jgi:hypothetical protein